MGLPERIVGPEEGCGVAVAVLVGGEGGVLEEGGEVVSRAGVAAGGSDVGGTAGAVLVGFGEEVGSAMVEDWADDGEGESSALSFSLWRWSFFLIECIVGCGRCAGVICFGSRLVAGKILYWP